MYIFSQKTINALHIALGKRTRFCVPYNGLRPESRSFGRHEHVRSHRSSLARFGALRANLFTYPIFTNFKTLVCTNIFRSGNLLSKGTEIDLRVPASTFGVNGILTRACDARFIKASKLKKVSGLRRVLFSKYLYVSPYWA